MKEKKKRKKKAFKLNIKYHKIIAGKIKNCKLEQSTHFSTMFASSVTPCNVTGASK
jgi:hypothetical protein